jgi:hypothetical protein
MINADRLPGTCGDRRGDATCQLAAGHDSAHAARMHGMLMSWINWGAATDGTRISTDWAEPRDRTRDSGD